MALAFVVLFTAVSLLILVYLILVPRERLAAEETHSRTGKKVQSLRQIYENYHYEEGFDHWIDYGDYYDRNLQQLRHGNSPINMLEIGVQSGGSINVWREYFGPENLRYTGMDINPHCRHFASEERHVSIYIGDQTNVAHLQEICANYGPFDLVVDDGFHATRHIMVSLYELWNCLNDGAVYAIEDLHLMSMYKGRKDMAINGQDVYGILGDILRNTSTYMSGEPPHSFSRHIKWMEASDSLIFYHYSKELIKPITRTRVGTKWVDNPPSNWLPDEEKNR